LNRSSPPVKLIVYPFGKPLHGLHETTLQLPRKPASERLSPFSRGTRPTLVGQGVEWDLLFFYPEQRYQLRRKVGYRILNRSACAGILSRSYKHLPGLVCQKGYTPPGCFCLKQPQRTKHRSESPLKPKIPFIFPTIKNTPRYREIVSLW
jgi:hypothetical protein